MIALSEELGLQVDHLLIGQYLQSPRIARDFAMYYDLYRKYRDQYQIDRILAGKADEALREQARLAPFDERLSLLGLLLDAICHAMQACLEKAVLVDLHHASLKTFRDEWAGGAAEGPAILAQLIQQHRKAVEIGERSATLSPEERHLELLLIQLLETDQRELLVAGAALQDDPLAILRPLFERSVRQLEARVDDCKSQLHELFVFVDAVYGDGHERMVLMAGLSSQAPAVRFISRFGCDDYLEHCGDLAFHSRKLEILARLAPAGAAFPAQSAEADLADGRQ
jgi:hypothetical protein